MQTRAGFYIPGGGHEEPHPPPLIKGNLQPNYSLFLKEAQYNALNCTLWHMYDFYLYLYTHLQKVQMNRKVHLFLVQEAVKSGAQG